MDTGTTLLNIAGVYQQTRQYSKALPFYIRAICILKELLGVKHSFVAVTIADIALLNSNLKYYEDAIEIFNLALELYDIVFGRDHPSTARVLMNIGKFYQDELGEFVKAKEYLEEAFRINELLFGKDDERTIESLNRLNLQ